MTKTLIATAVLTMTAGLASADILANSSSDFAVDQLDGSLEQGFNGWFYGAYNGDSDNPFTSSDFEQMNIVDDLGGSIGEYYNGGPSQWLGAGLIDPGYGWRISWLHPNGSTTTQGKVSDRIDAVRRWVSTGAGPMTISGLLAHRYDSALGDGATASIIVDGVEVYSHHVDAGDFNGVGYSFDVDLSVGSIVDFVVTAGQNADYDTILFDSQIANSVIPAPAGLAVLGLGGIAGFRRRR